MFSLTSVESLVYGQFNCSKTFYLCSDFATVVTLVYELKHNTRGATVGKTEHKQEVLP
jgi:hypothetical protein